MNLPAKMLLNGARLAALFIVSNTVLGCVGGSDGELSDEEKLKKMNQGRPAYGQSTGNSTTGK